MNESRKVILAAMPFAPLQTPSLALGLLHGQMDRLGYPCQTLNFALKFAQKYGAEVYDQISDGYPARTDLVGDWIFSEALFPSQSQNTEVFIQDVLHGKNSSHNVSRDGKKDVSPIFISKVREMRSQARAFVDSCAKEIVAHEPKIVGITSIFQSHVAALGLAKAIKKRQADIVVILGGSNCDGVMGIETAKQFSFLGAVCVGEGDDVFSTFVERVYEQKEFSDIKGIHTPLTASNATSIDVAKPVTEMDSLPYPNFDDHFREIRKSPEIFENIAPPHLMFETARGCWWGERQHCTFCGLNGTTMAFRSKSPDRAFEELAHLREEYGNMPVAVSDNILDMKYLNTFLEDLSKLDDKPSLFYEVKSNLRREQIRQMKLGGVNKIQPGIESFSTNTLKLMRKGVSAIQNIQTLKWCSELDVAVAWGFLWGFPGEQETDYRKTIELVKKLHHLPPPSGLTKIRLDRFSPNFTNAKDVGFENVRPFPAYKLVYNGLASDAVGNLAYFFDYDSPTTDHFHGLSEELREAVEEWRAKHKLGLLCHLVLADSVVIFDFRENPDGEAVILSGLSMDVFLHCETMSPSASIQSEFIDNPYRKDDNNLNDVVSALIEQGVLIELDGKFLTISCRLGDFPVAPSIEVALNKITDQILRRRAA